MLSASRGKVDIEGLKYHADMIAVCLNNIREGIDSREAMQQHMRQVDALFEAVAKAKKQTSAERPERYKQ